MKPDASTALTSFSTLPANVFRGTVLGQTTFTSCEHLSSSPHSAHPASARRLAADCWTEESTDSSKQERKRRNKEKKKEEKKRRKEKKREEKQRKKGAAGGGQRRRRPRRTLRR